MHLYICVQRKRDKRQGSKSLNVEGVKTILKVENAEDILSNISEIIKNTISMQQFRGYSFNPLQHRRLPIKKKKKKKKKKKRVKKI